MKNYDCVFVYFNIITDLLTGAEYQINSAYIRCFLSKHGITTAQYINQYSVNQRDYIRELVQLNTKNYAFYIGEYNYYITKIIINRLKKKHPDRNIYILGPSAKYIACFLSADIDFDISIVKHEHYAIKDLICGDKKEICNIIYRDDNTMVPTKEKEFFYTLDDLGLPYSEGFIPVTEAGNVGMISSEGCHGKCVFCSYNVKHCNYIMHEISSVVKELDYISTYISGNQSDLRFLDDCFSVSEERTIELLKTMEQRNYNFKFWCCIRADILSEEIIEYMNRLSFKKVVIGLETASSSVFSRIGKTPYSAEQYIDLVERKFKMAQRIDPIISVNFGLPNESKEEAVQTIDFITRIRAEKNTSICFMTCFPGSKIFSDSEEYKVIKEISPTKLPFRTFYNNYSMQDIFNQLYDLKMNQNGVDRYKMSIINKYVELFTGIYLGTNSRAIIDSIIVDEITEENLKFIDKNIAAAGVVIQNADKLIMSNRFYCDNRKQLKIQMSNFDKTLESAYQSDYYIPNQSYIKISDNFIAVQHNNEYLRDIIKIPMENIVNNIKALIDEAKQFFDNNVIDINLERFNIYN